MKNDCDSLIIDINLAGLYAEDRFTRELSIFQLQNHLAHEKVLLELKKAIERESDPELKHQIKLLVDLSNLEKSQSQSSGESESDLVNPAEIWFARSDLSVDQFLALLRKFDSAEQIDFLCKIVENEINPLRLIPFFSKASSLLQNDKAIRSFAGKLNSSVDVFLIRLITFLNRSAPGFILKRIQFLLAHENFYVKILTLRTLHRFYPNHAVRLLNELIIVRKSNLAACNLLFLFPFADVSNIVLKLLENGAMKDVSIRKAIENLVLNNPDPDFFALLIKLELLRGEELSGLREIREKALDGLEIAGLISGDRNSFLQESFAGSREELQKQTGIEVVCQTQPDFASPEANETAETRAAGLKQAAALFEKNALSDDDMQTLRQILAINEEPAEVCFKLIKKFGLEDDFVKTWLEHSLFAGAVDSRIQAMQLLAEREFSRLLPHLPVLCLDSTGQVSLNSIRLFRKFAEKKLLHWLEKWLKEDSEKTWKAALAGLLQVDADEAKALLLKHFAVSERVSFIRFFSPVFTVSPDFRSLRLLEKLLENCRGPKREALFDQITLLQKSLDKTGSGTAEVAVQKARDGLKEKWEEISENLEKFSYLADETELVEKTLLFLKKKWPILCLITLLSGILLYHWYQPATRNQEGNSAKHLLPQKIVQELPPLESGTIKFMTLNRYDPINQFWEATGSGGTRYKLKLMKPEQFTPGFKGNFQVLHYRISFSGYPVVSCRYVEP